jgi:hypothetical protein
MLPTTGNNYCLQDERYNFYYAFGNSSPENLFGQVAIHDNVNRSALSLGAGDIRFLLYTLCEAHRSNCSAELNFVLNDWNSDIIARNIVILYALITKDVDSEMLVQFWFSLKVTQEAYDYWMDIVKLCLKVDWMDKTNGTYVTMYDAETIQMVLHVWKCWLSCDWTLSSLDLHRDKYLDLFSKGPTSGRKELVEWFISTSVGETSESVKNKLRKELNDYYNSGSLVEGEKVNPSLLLTRSDGSFYYALHYASNPYESYHIIPELGLKKSLLLGISKLTMPFSKKVLGLGLMPFSICYSRYEALEFMDKLIQTEKRFDVVETSNLSDHVGLLPILVHASVLLKPNSLIKACSFLSYEDVDSRTGYVELKTGLPISAFPTILGLRFQTPNESSWKSFIHPFCTNTKSLIVSEGRNYEYFVFSKATRPMCPTSLSKSAFLMDALANCVEKMMCSYNLKQQSHCTPALFGKMLSFAYSEQRLTTNDSAVNNIPFEEPKGLFSRLLTSASLKGSMAELFVYCQLFGFPTTCIQDIRNETPFLAKIILSVPKLEVYPTPNFIISIEAYGVNHYFQSSVFKPLGKGKVQFQFYIPYFLGIDVFSSCVIHLWFGYYNGLVPILEPAVSEIPFENSVLYKTKLHQLAFLIESMFVQSNVLNSGLIAVKLDYLQEFEDRYVVKILLLKTDATLRASEKDSLFDGLLVDGKLYKVVLNTAVELKNCKIHRKSGFVILNLIKVNPNPLPTFISINDLNIMDQSDMSRFLGQMFMGNFMSVKSGISPQSSLSKIDSLIFDLCENVQILFGRAIEKFPGIFIFTDSLGIVGCILFHGIFSHPQIDSNSRDTPILDASFTFFEIKDTDCFTRIHNQFGNNCAILTLSDSELTLFKELLAFYHRNSVVSTHHPDVKKTKGENCFQRVAIHPLYILNVNRLVDSGSENRKKKKLIQEKSRDSYVKMMQGDYSGFAEMMAGIENPMEIFNDPKLKNELDNPQVKMMMEAISKMQLKK